MWRLHLEALGFRRAMLPKADYPKLGSDVPTLDFSGFPIYTHANVPDSVVTTACAALEARKEKIIWQEPGPLPLESICRDTPSGPLNILLHPVRTILARARVSSVIVGRQM